MRFNCHAHIFNFKAVFTEKTLQILVSRLSREHWPAFAVKAAEKALGKLLKGEQLDENILLAELVGALKADKAVQKLLQKGAASLPPSVSIALEGDVTGLPAGALREILSKVTTALQAADEDDAKTGDLGDFVAFLALGIKPSIPAVAAKLMEYSGPDTACVALMMDITTGGDADDALFRGQIEDTARAALRFPGRILPFVAVNPLRKLHYERMTHALEERGFVGVKLYPSLGYPVESDEMDRVYRYCIDHDTPLLLHCNNGGFYEKEACIQYCDPAAWEPILAKYRDLRVCFGHFGGDENLTVPAVYPASWTGKILDLMRRFPRVYADISYHDDPMNGGNAETNYFRNLGEILADPVCGERVLFGSDFLLVRQRLRDDNLWRFFSNRFTAAQFKRITETNPTAYLGLPGANGRGARPNVLRHLRFLAKYNLEVGEQPAPWVLQAITAEFGAVKFEPNEFGTDWTINNEAHFHTWQYFRTLMHASDANTLTFAQAGHVRMRDLPAWPSLALPTEIRDAALLQLTTRLQVYLTQMPVPGAALEGETTSAQARKILKALFTEPDANIARFGPAVDQFYRFNSESAPA